MSSSAQDTRTSFLSRRIVVNSIVAALFLAAMTAAVYWLSSGDPEKSLGRARMLEELRDQQKRQEEPEVTAAGYDVVPLVDDEYFWRLKEDLARAGSSVEVMMFEIKLGKTEDNPANRLVSELIAAKNRGVTVRVRLEQSNLDRSLTRSNRKTSELLKSHGIYAEFDLPDVETHAKVVLIDGRILYVGNHNWSESALARNKEVSLRIESPKPVSAMKRYFDRFDQSMKNARRGTHSS